MVDVRDACNLSDEALAERRETLRRELAPHVRVREALPDGVALGFDDTPARRADLEAFVAFERECCPGLEFALDEGADGLRLEIRGLASDAAILAEVGVPGAEPSAAAAPERARAGGGGWRAVLRAAGLGGAGAFVLFCLVPMAAVAWLGAEWAATLGALDHPLAVAFGGLLFGGLAWRRARRRDARCGC